MNEIKRIGRKLIHKGHVVDFYEDTIQLPDGKCAQWDFLAHVGAAAVLPVLSDGRIVMVRQYRNAFECETIEIPAGSLDYAGEPTLDAARRELAEETGYTAESFELLVSVYTAVAYCNETIDIYVAKGLKAGEQHLDADEYVSVAPYEVDELVRMIRAGEIRDAKTVAAVMAYKCIIHNS